MVNTPKTSSDILQMLESYHQQRHDTYRQLATRADDARLQMLLEHLVSLENDALVIIHGEQKQHSSRQASHLMSGQALTIQPAHAMDCQCSEEPTFDAALACALTSDAALDELIDLLQSSNAAQSIQDLAARLREAERTKDRQIAKFTRED